MMIKEEGEHRVGKKQQCKKKGTTNSTLEVKCWVVCSLMNWGTELAILKPAH